MTLPICVPYLPIVAVSPSTIPEGPDWQYEPKWDGFRCLAFRDGKRVKLQSEAGQPLEHCLPGPSRSRPDKAPRQCTVDQIEGEKSSRLLLLKQK